MFRKFKTAKQAHFLAAIGVTQVALGASYMDPSNRAPGGLWAVEVIPVLPWIPGVTLLVTGALALTAAALRRRRLYKWAFSFAIFPYSVLATTFLVSSIVDAHFSGWVSAISYAGFAAVVWVAANVLDWPREFEKLVDDTGERGNRGTSARDNRAAAD